MGSHLEIENLGSLGSLGMDFLVDHQLDHLDLHHYHIFVLIL